VLPANSTPIIAPTAHIAGIPWSSIFRGRKNPEWLLMLMQGHRQNGRHG